MTARRFAFGMAPPRVALTLGLAEGALTVPSTLPANRDLVVLVGPPGADGAPSIRHSFSFGDATPFAFATPASGVTLQRCRVIIDTAFNGVGASISVGSSATPDLLMPSSGLLPGVAGSYETSPDLKLNAALALSIFITPGSGASAGAGRIIIET